MTNKLSEKGIRTWVRQFTPEDQADNEVNTLLAKRCLNNFPGILFFTMNRLMASCRSFMPEKVATIKHFLGITSATLSADDRYVVTSRIPTVSPRLVQMTGIW